MLGIRDWALRVGVKNVMNVACWVISKRVGMDPTRCRYGHLRCRCYLVDRRRRGVLLYGKNAEPLVLGLLI